MIDVISHLLHGLRETIISKSFVVVGATVGAANIPASSPQFIDFTTTGMGPFTIAGWISLTGCFWLFTQIIDKWGFFKLVKFLWEKYRNKPADKIGKNNADEA